MKRVLTIILILLLFPFSISFAGNEYGNGGDVVYCPQEDGPPKVEMLDFYEAITRWKLELDLGPPELSPMEKVNYVLDRLLKIDQFRAKYYRKVATEFFDNALFLSGITLPDMPDSQFTYIPSGCEIRQIAIQKEPQFPGEMLYTISKDLWDMLDSNQKAGLILHEIVYGEAIKLRHQDSINARYFMGHIASNKIDELSLSDYAKLFNLTNFADWGVLIDGIKYNIDKLYFFDNGKVKAGSLFYSEYPRRELVGYPEETTREIRGNIFSFSRNIEFFESGTIKNGLLSNVSGFRRYDFKTEYGCKHKIRSLGILEFSNDGTLMRTKQDPDSYTNPTHHLAELQLVNSGTCYTIGSVAIKSREIEYYKNGMFKYLILMAADVDSTTKLPVFGKRITFTNYNVIHFHENGFVKSGQIHFREQLMTNENSTKDYSAGTHLEFDEEGRVIVK